MIFHWLRLLLDLDAPGPWLILSLISGGLLLLLQNRMSSVQIRRTNFLYWILIPYLGLFFGSLSTQRMGLVGIDWTITFSRGAEIVFVALAMVGMVRVLMHAYASSQVPEAPFEKQSIITISSPTIWTHTIHQVLLCGAQQFHWIFIRSGVWDILLNGRPIANASEYTAIWIATLLSVPGILLRRENFLQQIQQLVLLALTAVLFFLTHNFWLCWFLHATLWLLRFED